MIRNHRPFEGSSRILFFAICVLALNPQSGGAQTLPHLAPNSVAGGTVAAPDRGAQAKDHESDASANQSDPSSPRVESVAFRDLLSVKARAAAPASAENRQAAGNPAQTPSAV